MTAAFTHAKMVGAKRVACASTGNTSASLAMFASLAEVQGIVFIGSGKISFGKLSQALDYGALTLQIQGDFDACLRRIRQIAADPRMGIYLMNSVNPFRLEGQKSIMLRILEARDWEPPDWIIVPGGNLGNCSAFGKAFMELKELGLIKKVPRLAVINADRGQHAAHAVNDRKLCGGTAGAYDAVGRGRALRPWTPVRTSHAEHGRQRDRDQPAGEPAQGAAGAGLHGRGRAGGERRRDPRTPGDGRPAGASAASRPAPRASPGCGSCSTRGSSRPDESVVCVLTGHELKDPNATVKYHTGLDLKAAQDLAPWHEPHGKLSNRPVPVADDLPSIVRALGEDPDRIKLSPLPASAGGF